MQDRTPRYRYGFFRVAPGSDHCAVAIGIRRVDGDPDGGPLGMRTSSDGIGLDLLLSDLQEIVGSLQAADEPDGKRPQPIREWVFDPWNGPLVMKELKA